MGSAKVISAAEIQAQSNLGARLARARRKAALTQEELAGRVAYSRSTVANTESGRQCPPRPFWIAADEALGTDGALTADYDRIATDPNGSPVRDLDGLTQGERPPRIPSHLLWFDLPGPPGPTPETAALALGRSNESVETPSGHAPHDPGYDRQAELVEVGARLRYFATPTVSSSFLDYLDDVVEDCVASYEARGPAALMPLIVRQRKDVQTLIEGWQPARDRDRLLRVAGRLSGLAGYKAVNLGDFRLARAYCAEAFALARLAEDDNLVAWVRGTESLCAYYAGDY